MRLFGINKKDIMEGKIQMEQVLGDIEVGERKSKLICTLGYIHLILHSQTLLWRR
jgi:activator of HSP90 ATPase